MLLLLTVATHCECTINLGFTHASFVRNVAHMRFFSSSDHEFLNWENFIKAKTHHLGKFARRENNMLYGIHFMQKSFEKHLMIVYAYLWV